MTPKPRFALTETEIAAVSGVSDTTWKAHRDQGAPVPRSRAKLSEWLVSYHRWRRENGKGEHQPRRVPDDADQAAHLKELTRLRAQRLRMEIAREQRLLLPRERVVQYAAGAVSDVSQALDALIRRVAARLGPLCQGGAVQVEVVLQGEVEELRAGFALRMGGVADAAGD